MKHVHPAAGHTQEQRVRASGETLTIQRPCWWLHMLGQLFSQQCSWQESRRRLGSECWGPGTM